MKPTIMAALVAAGVTFCATAQSQSGESIAKSKGCVACHESDAGAGPTFKKISAKYKGNEGAEARLVAKLQKGTSHAKVEASGAELKSVIQYVLKQ